ncbi:ABC transporter ATP-binding protein [Holophaga foetida]|uniref:ABC transporter ATP-binding protein n=1 Tax=Holophaga foetida TaxID=35839 RepID=UPI0002474682|nr:ABC transporter ATP-binding protein [Holophaga foetida]
MSLDVQNLSFAYEQRVVLQNVSFTAPTGQFTVILGRNGSGKSTILKLLAGVLPFHSGRVQAHGQDLRRLSGSARASLLGYLPQFHRTVFPFAVQDVVLTGRAAFVLSTPGPRDRKLAQEAMEELDLLPLAERPYSELSGGERQIVLMARILAQRPRIILLDEPVSHLDLAHQQRLMRLLKRLTQEGTTVISVLHDPNAALLYGDHFVFLKEGRVIEPGGHPWSPTFMEEVYGVRTLAVPFGGGNLVIPEPAGGCHV